MIFTDRGVEEIMERSYNVEKPLDPPLKASIENVIGVYLIAVAKRGNINLELMDETNILNIKIRKKL